MPTHIIANEDVLIEPKALEQLSEISRLDHAFKSLGIAGEIERVVATPDLHVGSPFPVGVAIKSRGLVIPGAVGNDIGCGMRLCAFDVTENDLDGRLDLLEKNLRHVFFEGGRDIPLSPRQRRMILREGLMGLCETFSDNAGHGIWNLTDRASVEKQMARTHSDGSLISDSIFSGHERWTESSGSMHGRDDQIGSLGGSNHFEELQVVDEVVDAHAAKAYGLKEGQLCVMVHTGSVLLGQAVGSHYKDVAKDQLKGAGIPEHLNPLVKGRDQKDYIDHMSSAANFATVNRLTLSMMFQKALEKTLGREISMSLVWDAPHNLTWKDGDSFLHRKGATPALGPSAKFNWAGEPVLLPGSMGDYSWVLSGLGSERSLMSASHGAGRALSRTAAAHIKTDEIEKRSLRVVTPVDLKDLVSRGRSDIAKEIQKRLKEESPLAYKPVLPALESLEQAGAAKRAARMRPILTVKGI